mmetsp:Transcript_22989/g.71495  ORF Transcript_22989/g.71495 Transcript_22989/m.71495 type:complete len:307 (+) Transcript_22989:829-1749(+)
MQRHLDAAHEARRVLQRLHEGLQQPRAAALPGLAGLLEGEAELVEERRGAVRLGVREALEGLAAARERGRPLPLAHEDAPRVAAHVREVVLELRRELLVARELEQVRVLRPGVGARGGGGRRRRRRRARLLHRRLAAHLLDAPRDARARRAHGRLEPEAHLLPRVRHHARRRGLLHLRLRRRERRVVRRQEARQPRRTHELLVLRHALQEPRQGAAAPAQERLLEPPELHLLRRRRDDGALIVLNEALVEPLEVAEAPPHHRRPAAHRIHHVHGHALTHLLRVGHGHEVRGVRHGGPLALALSSQR